MLNIKSGNDVDARIRDFPHVLITFGVSAARHVGVGQFICQDYLRLLGKDGIKVHLFQANTALFCLLSRNSFQTFTKLCRLLAVVGLY